MRKSTEQKSLCPWSDIQLSVYKTEHYVLWRGGQCHHTQARLGSWQQSLNWKLLTLSYRREHLIVLFSVWLFFFSFETVNLRKKTALFSEVSWNNANLMFKLHSWWDLLDSYSLGFTLLLWTVRVDWQTMVTLLLANSSWTSAPLQASVSKECTPSFVLYMYTSTGTYYDTSLGTKY